MVPDSSVDYRQLHLLNSSPDNLNVWWMNILVVMTLLLFAPTLVLLFRRARGESGFRQLVPVTVLMLASIFMALPLSRPLWKLLPPLQQIQFPWRWLAVVSMAGSLLAAATIPIWLKNKMRWPRPLRILVLGSVLVSVAFTLAHTVREAEYLNRPRFESEIQRVRGTASVNYWIPVWAKANPRAMAGPVEAGNRAVAINEWQSEHRRFEVAAGEVGEARVRTFYYPHWVASSAGRVLNTRPDSDGAILISVPAAATAVELDFREPRRTRVAMAASACGWLFIGLLAFAPLGRRKDADDDGRQFAQL